MTWYRFRVWRIAYAFEAGGEVVDAEGTWFNLFGRVYVRLGTSPKLTLLAFAMGFVYEAICTAWVTAVYERQPILAGSMAMFAALTVIVGVGEGTKNRFVAIAYALGCGIGTATMVVANLSKKMT